MPLEAQKKQAAIQRSVFESQINFETCTIMADAKSILESQHQTFARYAAIADRALKVTSKISRPLKLRTIASSPSSGASPAG